MKTLTIFYTGSANTKNPHNLVNYWNEHFTGTKKEAKAHAAKKKEFLKKNEIVTGRIKVDIK